jgi:hypothetical protein
VNYAYRLVTGALKECKKYGCADLKFASTHEPQGERMRTPMSLIVGAAAITAAALAAAGFGTMANPPQAEQVLNPSFSVDVRPGVKAQGFVALSKPYDTADSPARRVRVLAYSIKFLINGQERLGSFGMADVEADRADAHQSAVGGSGPGKSPLPGEELLPRRFSVSIRPRGDLTWGEVVDRNQLDVTVEWVLP